VTSNGPSHRVLVVDDEPNIVDVISMALRFQGFTLAAAGTGVDALAAVGDFKPDLIVLDVMLPDMEGSRSPSGWALSVAASRSSS
jgi:two-component system, OmpR family, response regulator